MSDGAPIDWLRSGNTDRAALYRAVKRALNERGLRWQAFYIEAWNLEAVGSGTEDNFRAGTVGRSKALQAYRWLRCTDDTLADALDFELARHRPQPAEQSSPWLRLVRSSPFRSLDVVSIPRARLSIVAFMRAEPVAERRIKHGEPFCLRLDAPIEARVAAFQRYKSRWYVLPLDEGAHSVSLPQGLQIVPPPDKDKRPRPLSEESDAGLFGFLVVGANDARTVARADQFPAGTAVPPDELDGFAAEFLSVDPKDRFGFRLNVMIEG